jgi:alpha-beta hydrolase superfamily lysophospholipase
MCHGFGEHAHSYDGLMERLAGAGYACAIFNQRGHGQLRPNERGVISGYDAFLDDVARVTAQVRERFPGVPLALYGHSMGGNIAINYLIRRGASDFVCAVLESPWLGLYAPPNALLTRVVKLLSRVAPNFAIQTKLEKKAITGDPEKEAALNADSLYHNRISMRMLAGILDACGYALEHAALLTLPAMLAYASNERVVSNKEILDFIAKGGENITPKEYESSHCIHNDLQREAYTSDIAAFLDAHCKRE